MTLPNFFSDDEDAAVVVTILTAIASQAAAARGAEQAEQQSFWGDPAFRTADAAPGRRTWWASGLPR
jgi:hypothetical protein